MRRSRRSLIAVALGAVLLLPACPSADAGDADVEITDTGTPTDGTTEPTETDSEDSGGGYDY
jgi:major membrane immunogen (membrane-anchored lipoprotein)